MELPKGDMGTYSKDKTKQISVRSYANSVLGNNQVLNEYLEYGYKVVFAIKITDGVIEYILEK